MLLSRSVGAAVTHMAIRDSMDILMNFGRVRLWGSIAFILVTWGVGYFYDLHGPNVFVPAGAALLLGLAINCVFTANVIRGREEEKSGLQEVWNLLQLRTSEARYFMLFLLSSAFVWASHAVLYTYFSIYLHSLGWSGSKIAAAWMIGVFAEVIMLHYFDNLQKRYALSTIYLVSIIITVLRWSLLATTTNATVIMLSQLLHAFTFGSIYVSGMKIAHIIAPQSIRAHTQNFLAAFGGGVGILFGRLAAGHTAELLGDSSKLHFLFYAAAILAIFSYVSARYALSRTSRSESYASH